MSKFVNSKIKLNIPKLNQLSKAAITALEETTEKLHNEVMQDQVIPFGKDIMKDGKVIHQGGYLKDNTFSDYSEGEKGKTDLISSTPYARRMYYHPEYNFNREEHKNAKGKWYDDYITGLKKDFCNKTFTKIYKKEAGL